MNSLVNRVSAGIRVGLLGLELVNPAFDAENCKFMGRPLPNGPRNLQSRRNLDRSVRATGGTGDHDPAGPVKPGLMAAVAD